MMDKKILAIDFELGFPIVGGKSVKEYIKTEDINDTFYKTIKDYGHPFHIIDRIDIINGSSIFRKKFIQDVIISKDHLITFFGLRELSANRSKFGLIVIDQHLDIYSYQTHGSSLNKCNVLRYCFDRGLMRHFCIVGVRPSEEEGFDDFHSRFISNYRVFTEGKRYGGMEGYLTIFRTDEIISFEEGVCKAAEEAMRKGCKFIGIDIDLDGFDSNLIQGVQINDLFIKLVREKIDSTTAEYLHKQLREKGLEIRDIARQIRGVKKFLAKWQLSLIYKGITEFKPENDLNNKTKELVKEIVDEF